ncbi:RloB family protein [Brucella anthropi]|uniref:RloB family protein n=1 Tax=Brucella anthropi TaxID=529 RepID=UPI00055D9330|nr:RloB family protein [Brucella anthropi]
MRPKRNLSRKLNVIAKRPVFVLVVEGENTEPEYFEELCRRNNQIIADIETIGAAGDPSAIARQATAIRTRQLTRKYIRDNGANDRVWAVFDRDEHHHFDAALKSCSAGDVEVAYCVPCFELWLILHFQDYDKDETRHDTQKACEKACPGYAAAKRKVPQLVELVDNVEAAEKRADAMQTRRDKDASISPITTVQRLTRALRGL